MKLNWFVTVADEFGTLRTIYPSAFTLPQRTVIHGIIVEHVTPSQPQMLGERSLVRIAPKEIPNEKANLLSQGEIARESGYLGDPCDMCQQFKLRRTGTCVTCENCGANSGCS